jgi:hypothetical protein
VEKNVFEKQKAKENKFTMPLCWISTEKKTLYQDEEKQIFFFRSLSLLHT